MNIRWRLHRLRLWLIYTFSSRHSLVPPKELDFVGGGPFEAVGREFLGFFRDLCSLQPQAKVLEIGCGIGRIAAPLTSFLDGSGEYHGMDIVPIGIKWCRRNISRRFPNFFFHHADIRNEYYNSRGRFTSEDYRFPFADEQFDFIFLSSVFTHLLPREIEHYLDEIARVLRPGGRCLITFFLLNEESRKAITEGTSTQNFAHQGEGYLYKNPDCPPEAVAYDEAYIRTEFQRRNLRIEAPLRFGNWCGREPHFSYQDIVIASRA